MFPSLQPYEFKEKKEMRGLRLIGRRSNSKLQLMIRHRNRAGAGPVRGGDL